jgi:alkylhydroperoxidase family enzyme
MRDDECTETAQEFFAQMEGPKGSGLSKFQIVRILAWNPDLATSYFAFGQHVLRRSSLPRRLQSLVTLRTAWLHRCDYEWTPHARRAPHMGVSAEEVEAIKIGSSAPMWNDADRTVLRAVEELCDRTTISDDTWDALATVLSRSDLLDLLFTVGHYAMMAMAVNALHLEPDEPS